MLNPSEQSKFCRGKDPMEDAKPHIRMAISNSMTMVNALIKPVARDIRVSSIVSSGIGGIDHPLA
jgi:hypothetical protein